MRSPPFVRIERVSRVRSAEPTECYELFLGDVANRGTFVGTLEETLQFAQAP